ncbi:MAG: SHOCT domain-containing protein [Candidatus Aminicenantales bacterium]
MMSGGFGFMGGFMWIFWIAVIAGIVLLIKWAVQSRPGAGQPELNSLEILKNRYARGEIGKEEYEQKKKDLI